MLGKLVKYELRSSFKKLGVLWLAALAMLALNTVILNVVELPDSFWSTMLITLPVMMLFITCIAVVVMSFVFIVTRFYKGMLGDEGYLMFTLPVKTSELVLSKAIGAFIVQLISAAIAVVPLIVTVIFHPDEVSEVLSGLSEIYSELHMSGPLYMVIVCVSALVAAVELVFRLYLSMSLGHLAKKHRVAWSVGAYVAVNYLVGAASAMVQLAFACNFIMSQATGSEVRYPIEMLIGNLVCYIIFAVVEYVLTLSILKKRLNLE